VDTIASTGDRLWKDLVGDSTTLNVTSVQLAFTGIDVTEAGQRSIEVFLKPASAKRSREEANALFNEAAGSFRGDDPVLPNDQMRRSLPLPYTCPRCGKIFQYSRTNQSSNDQEAELAKVKMEHSDYHFAQDLATEGPSRSVTSASKPTTSNSIPSKRLKRSTEPKGIEKFFRK
jgi:DNA polymerase eta